MEDESGGLKVSCYAGYRGDQRPLAFGRGSRRIDVTEILAAWIEPHRRCFRINAADGLRYLLCQDTESLHWSLAQWIRSCLNQPGVSPKPYA